MPNKNATAAFITYCIALIIAWFFAGHTTQHIWSAWLFFFLFLIGIIVFVLNLVNCLKIDEFDGATLFCIVGIVIFELISLDITSDIGLQWLNIIAYIIGISLGLLLIFTAVRYLQSR